MSTLLQDNLSLLRSCDHEANGSEGPDYVAVSLTPNFLLHISYDFHTYLDPRNTVHYKEISPLLAKSKLFDGHIINRVIKGQAAE
jgi:hypothetical protein